MSLYVRVLNNFYTHRKTLRLKAAIGDAAYWVPPRLWAYAAENQPDGCFKDYSAQELAMLIGYASNAQALLQALLQAGFLDDGPLRIHDWGEHNGYHSTFAERAKKAATIRWERSRARQERKVQERKGKEKKGKETSIATSNACSTEDADASRPVRVSFVKPSLEEMNLHAAKIGLPSAEVDAFVNYYESNGWKVGKNKMVSWQAAMSGWRTRWEERRRPAKAPFAGTAVSKDGFKIGVQGGL